MIQKVKVFEAEMNQIKDDKIKKFAEVAVNKLPDYFFEVAASSTGKYHPAYSLGTGGLVRHTKAAVGFATTMLGLEFMQNYFTPTEQDLMIVSLILHDGCKHGLNGSSYTVATHPLEICDMIRKDEELTSLLPADQLEFIYKAVSSHMGQWNTDFKTKKEILPKPETKFEMFVHLCDYLASRKYLTYEFEGGRYELKNYVLQKKSEAPASEESGPQRIIAICKEKIANGADRNNLYALIAKHNGGNKNPKTITDKKVVENIINELGGM